MAYELINFGQATPHRLHALIRLLARADEWERSELLYLLQPTSLDPQQQAAKAALTALKSLDLVEETDGTVRLKSTAVGLVELEAFRHFLASSVSKARRETHVNYRFTLFTAWYSTKNEEVFSFSNDVLINRFNDQMPFGSDDRIMNSTKFNAWRTLAAFLGYGWVYSGKVVPDATDRIRPEIQRLLMEDGDISFAEFVSRLSASCAELDHGELFQLAWTHSRSEQLGNRLSLMLSNALRRLNEDKTIVLSQVPDAGDIWQLFPAAGFPPEEITHIRRGVYQ
jgi:hypothetical protein